MLFFSFFYSIFVVKFLLILLYQFSRKSFIFNNESAKHETSASKKRDKLEDRAGNWYGADQWMFILDMVYVHYKRIPHQPASKLETLWIRECSLRTQSKTITTHFSVSPRSDVIPFLSLIRVQNTFSTQKIVLVMFTTSFNPNLKNGCVEIF